MSAEVLDLDFALARGSLALALRERMPLEGVSAIFGPSGSGKSTLLRALAGFEQPDRGHIHFAGTPWFDAAQNVHRPPHQRPVGLMFQEARLFEHRSVAANLDMAERFSRKRLRSDQATPDREQVIAALDLAPLLARAPATLSGGEQRRVALARTLLARPRLLLLDEPLTGLDHERKADILPYLQQALRTFTLPTLYVSHDIDEVALLADRLWVLDQGRVKVSGPTAELIEQLELNAFTGRFEAGVLITGQVAAHDQARHVTTVMLDTEPLTMPLQANLPLNSSVRLRVRARDVALATIRPQGLSIRNILPGQLLQLTAEPQPGSVDALVQVANTRIRARLTQAAVEDLALQPGASVFVLIKSASFESSA